MSKPIPPISKYMTTTPTTTRSDTTLAEASRLMETERIRHLPVVEGERLLGVITDRDLDFVATFKDVDTTRMTVAEAMIEKPYFVAPETPIDEVALRMAEERYGSALVVQNKRVVGIFTTVDACRCLAELLDTRLRK